MAPLMYTVVLELETGSGYTLKHKVRGRER
jgi:hypothetical protein